MKSLKVCSETLKLLKIRAAQDDIALQDLVEAILRKGLINARIN